METMAMRQSLQDIVEQTNLLKEKYKVTPFVAQNLAQPGKVLEDAKKLTDDR